MTAVHSGQKALSADLSHTALISGDGRKEEDGSYTRRGTVGQALEAFTVAYMFANVLLYTFFSTPLDRYRNDSSEENKKKMREEPLLAVGFFAFTASGLVKQSHRFNDRKQARDLKVLDLPIWNLDWYGPTWLVNISIGSPGQPIAALINTSVADTGNVVSNTIGDLPNYNPNSSSTFQTDTSLVFQPPGPAETWGASGTYAQDTYNLGGVSLENVRFVELSADSVGHQDCYLGLGFKNTEASYTTAKQKTTYPTILDSLVSQGTLLSSSYSIWMNDKSGRTGHLLLGGIDTSKYVSPLISSSKQDQSARLTTVEIKDYIGGPYSTSIAADESVVFEIGSFTTLPRQIVTQIWDGLGAKYDHGVDPSKAVPIVPCSYKNSTSVLTFLFNSYILYQTTPTSVDVPLSEFIIQNGSGPHYDQGPYASACTLTISASYTFAIGTNVMKYLYVVFDASARQLSWAARNFNSTTASVYAIPDGGVPCMTQVNNAACAPSPSSGSGSGGGGLFGLAGGLGVGFGVLVALIFLMLVVLCCWKSRKTIGASVGGGWGGGYGGGGGGGGGGGDGGGEGGE